MHRFKFSPVAAHLLQSVPLAIRFTFGTRRIHYGVVKGLEHASKRITNTGAFGTKLLMQSWLNCYAEAYTTSWKKEAREILFVKLAHNLHRRVVRNVTLHFTSDGKRFVSHTCSIILCVTSIMFAYILEPTLNHYPRS